MIMEKIQRLLADKDFKKYFMSRNSKKEMEISVHVNQRVSVSHKLCDTLTDEESSNVIKLLVDEGLIHKILHTNAVICPYCEDINVRNEYKCPSCGNINIYKEYIIQHKKCGCSFPSESLSIEKCPVCGLNIKSSDDFSITGGLFKCKNCGFTFDTPKILFTCSNNHNFTIKEAKIKGIYTYEMDRESKNILDLMFTYKNLAEKLTDKGYEVEMPGYIIGVSGVNHDFIFVVKKNDRKLVVDLSGYVNTLDFNWVIKNHIKIMDIPESLYLYVVSNRNSEVEKLIERMPTKNVIIAHAKNVNEIINLIEKHLRGK